MIRMGKKRSETGGTGGDRHKSGKLIRIPETYHEILKEVARESARPLTWELRIALAMLFRARGKTLPPDDDIAGSAFT